MKKSVVSSTLLASAVALGLFASQANAATVNVVAQSTSIVPIDIPPGAPNPGFVNVLSDVVDNNLSSCPCYRSPFEGTAIQASAKYTSVEANGSGTYSRSGNTLFIFWGSPDQYNTITFMNGVNVVGSITGDGLTPPSPRIGHDLVELQLSSGTFDSVVLTSTGQDAFEFSDLISCDTGSERGCAQIPSLTPVPAALPMFVSAVAGVGGIAGWRKRRKKTTKA